MSQAYEMAVEALGLALVSRKEEKEAIPVPWRLISCPRKMGRW